MSKFTRFQHTLAKVLAKRNLCFFLSKAVPYMCVCVGSTTQRAGLSRIVLRASCACFVCNCRVLFLCLPRAHVPEDMRVYLASCLQTPIKQTHYK
jgi:hypothetical protein